VTALLNEQRKSARKAKGDGYLRRAEILSAAERIFVAHGYEAATIRKIADEVGVSSTALYMHFADKDQILLEICTGAMNELLAHNRQISAMPVDPAIRVRMMLEGYVRFGLAHPNTYRLVFCSPSVDAIRAQHETMQIGTECLDRFASVVREIAAQGRLRIGDPRVAHQALWAACHGMVTLMVTKPDLDWAPPEELLSVMIDGLFHGLIAD
jgi:AcrR family transcriptional regulator